MIKRFFLTLFIVATCNCIAWAQWDESCIEQNDPKSATVCYGVSIAIELDSAAVLRGEIEGYLWQQSLNIELEDWKDAEGDNTGINYITPKLEQSIYYRRKVFGMCYYQSEYPDTISSEAAFITVLPEFSAGAIRSKEINTNGNSITVNIIDSISASGGDNDIVYRWKMDNKVIAGEKPNLEIYTAPFTVGVYLFTREARDGACAGGWVASDGYCKIIVPDTTPPPPPPPPPCKLNLNDIVAKTDKNGTPYILIYPNPDRILQYQWYKDNKPIANAKEQFYYPSDGKLQTNAKYKVEIWEKHDPNCREYTNVYTFSGKSNSQLPYFTVSPNPVNGNYFTVSFNHDLLQKNTENCFLSIHSVVGEKIWEQKVNNFDDIHLSKHFVAGVYIITLTVENKQYNNKIIIK